MSTNINVGDGDDSDILIIGANNNRADAPREPYKGCHSDFLLFNRTLSEDEINWLKENIYNVVKQIRLLHQLVMVLQMHILRLKLILKLLRQLKLNVLSWLHLLLRLLIPQMKQLLHWVMILTSQLLLLILLVLKLIQLL